MKDESGLLERLAPTPHAYAEWQDAFDFFNERLFDGKLPQCLITFQRKSKVRGYYSRERFISRDGAKVDEIAMNPQVFALSPPAGVLSTLVHEMCHAWRYRCCETTCRRAYHDKIWAEKMQSVGLIPSHTGRPGGRKVGQSMSHYVLLGGPFDQACAELLEKGPLVTWFDRFTSTDVEGGHYFHGGSAPDIENGNTDNVGSDARDGDGADPDGTPPDGSGRTEAAPLAMSDLTSSKVEFALTSDGPGANALATTSLGLDDRGGDAPAVRDHGPAAPSLASKSLSGFALRTNAAHLKSQLITPSAVRADRKNLSNRSRYTCPECNLHVWGKPGLRLKCVTCDQDIAQDA